MNLITQPISEKIGQQIISQDDKSILEIDREEIISLFKKIGQIKINKMNKK